MLNISGIICIINNLVVIIRTVKDNKEKKETMNFVNIGLLSGAAFFALMFIIFFLGKLNYAHITYVVKNITFYEFFKRKIANPANDNPFNKQNIWQNFYRIIFKLAPSSYLNIKQE